MNSAFFTFDSGSFNSIFPFYVHFDSDLKIIETGSSMQKIVGEVTGRLFADVFSFVRPLLSIEMTSESIKEHQEIVIILESVDYPIKTRFRGQFVYLKETDCYLYLNSPWIIDSTDLSLHNLFISDFAVHDTITDNLQLLRSKQIVNDDLKRTADELILQRNELFKKNQLITELARFPDENPQPILRLNFNGDLLYANSPAHVLINESDLLNHPFWKTLSENSFNEKVQPLEREFRLGDSVYLSTIVPILEQKYVNVYFRNITETLRFQNELLTTSSKLTTLINSMNSAVLAEDMDRKILLVNQNFCSLFEIPLNPDAMIGFDCTEAAEQSKHLFSDEVVFVNRISEILEDKKPVFGDVLYMKNGKILERDYMPIFENDIYQGHIWKYQDVSLVFDHKESLRKVEEKYSRIIENLRFGLLEVDNDEIIVRAFPSFCEMFGYSQEELVGKSARDILSFDRDGQELDDELLARKEGGSGVYELMVKTKSEESKWVIISGSPIYNEQNEVVGSLGIHMDITDRKKMEQDLVKAKEQALSSSKSKELFLANISHEIRTPMHIVKGMAELLRNTETTIEQTNYIQAIENSSTNLMILINDILDFSKIESGKMELDSTTFSLNDLMFNLRQSFEVIALKKGISFSLDLDENLNRKFVGDSVKLNQILMNLIHNAIKFTSRGSISISCKIIDADAFGQRIKFDINDTGKGIDKQNHHLIFEDFSQEDNQIAKKYGGTGLGLSISAKLVRLMGGEIKLESQLGIGSSFSFELDLKFDTLGSEVEVTSKTIVKKLTHLNVLIAEDNELNVLLITTFLKQLEIKYTVVNNGYEVLEKLREQTFDLVLMDIQMPEMDGISATIEIRQKLKMDIPIIALTANASETDRIKYLNSGMNDYLSKPFKKDELIEKLNEYSRNATNVAEKYNASSLKDFDYSLSNLEELASGDNEFILSILQTFIDKTPLSLDSIKEGFANKDLGKIKFYAHQIKPSIDILDIRELKKTIRLIEEHSRKGIEVSYPDLEYQINILEDGIHSVINSLKQNYFSEI